MATIPGGALFNIYTLGLGGKKISEGPSTTRVTMGASVQIGTPNPIVLG